MQNVLIIFFLGGGLSDDIADDADYFQFLIFVAHKLVISIFELID